MVYIIGSGPMEVKGNILNMIEADLTLFRKNGDQRGMDAARLLMGEIQRDPNKDTSDENVTKILKKLRKITMRIYEATPDDEDNPNTDALIIQMIDNYIPPPVSDAEVMEWVNEKYSYDDIKAMGKSAFRIIGEVKKDFGDREVSIDVLKENIEEILNEKG